MAEAASANVTLAELAEEVRELRAENEELRERVEELESRGHIEWDSHKPEDMTVVSASDVPYPLGLAVDKRAHEDDVGELAERVQKIEEGKAEVVVRSETDSDALPIESRVARHKAGDDGLKDNEARAAIVFPKFYSRSTTEGGRKLVLYSGDVKGILGEKTDVDAADWHNETIRRTMRWLAKLTSRTDERNPRNSENLITLEDRNGSLALVADRDEWIEYYENLSGRQGGEP